MSKPACGPEDSVQLSALEQKFLLRLLEANKDRVSLSELHPNPQTSLAQRRRAAKRLRSLHLIEYSEAIRQIAITPKGRVMFDLEMAARPVTPDELLVLQSCRYNKITPGQISRKIPEAMKRSLVDALETRKFLKTQRQINEVWLTPEGRAYLRTRNQPMYSSP